MSVFEELDPSSIAEEVIGAVIVAIAGSVFAYIRSQRFRDFARGIYRCVVMKLRALGHWLGDYWQLMLALLLLVCVAIAGLLWIPRALLPLLLVTLGLALANALFTLWFHGEKQEGTEIFQDDFGTLDNWKTEGDWSIVDHNGERVLRVTDSGNGGIAKPCLSWTDYVFEFDTRIENKCSGWLVRAKDLNNYVMLQCQLDRIRPHFRIDGEWCGGNWIEKHTVRLPQVLSSNTWYHVAIEVRGAQVSLTIAGKDIIGERKEITGLPSLKHPEGAVTYSKGSVGFRESGIECAYFQNVRVMKLR